MDNNIQKLRELHNLSAKEVYTALGVSRSTLYNYEAGGTIPSDKLIIMSKLFNCSIDYILGLENEKIDCDGLKAEVDNISQSLTKILIKINK